jgi:hypothetical protein
VKKLYYSGLLLVAFSSLVFSQNSAHKNSQVHKIVVKEVLQTSSYTYLGVLENETITWLAVPKMDAVIDKIYYYQGGLEMRNFRSKELDTVFYSLMFVAAIFDEKILELNSDQQNDSSRVVEDTFIAPVKGGISISELLSNSDKYANSMVKLRGRVAKFNGNIMGLNWIHLEDGSGSSGESNVTITSNEIVSINDIITIEGIIKLNQDFGHGYFYKVLMENGKVIP